MKKIYTLSAVIISIAILGACDPSYLNSWYIENQIGEDIIVTRSDSSEISNVFIPNGSIGCIFQMTCLGGGALDGLENIHPEHHPKPYPNEEVAMNMHFWDMDNWSLYIDDHELTASWLYILTPDSIDDSWISRPSDK